MSCNLGIPDIKELKVKSTFEGDMREVIDQSEGAFSQNYSVKTWNYSKEFKIADLNN
ncbi:MAG: hypothetical protein KDC85_10860 [Saprospiraceae bacterium]|nr:hypothetical protein [Saprospiraceae bacterium]MCB9322462.1 hypothetical protein [Lewinellaceae bacterium]